MLIIVPEALEKALNAALDKAFQECPEATTSERRIHYEQLLRFFDEYGYVPEFKLEKCGEVREVKA